jgi:hypothetical protein
MKRNGWVLVPVLVLVNSAAIWGQTEWARENIVPADWTFGAGLALALGFAAGLELIGMLLATEADRAEEKGMMSGGIRIGSYGVGLVSGSLNLSHWGWNTAAGVAFAFLSAISPFLWGIHSRISSGRNAAPSRRFWHPIRSIELLRYAAWEGISDEEEALRRFQGEAEKEPSLLTAKEIPAAELEEIKESFLRSIAPTGSGKMGILTPEMIASLEAEEKEMQEEEKEYISDGEGNPTAEILRPISPARPRALRASWDAPKVVEMLLLGSPKAEILAATGVSLTSYGRISKVLRTLQNDPSIRIDAAKEKVSPDHIDMIRRALTR